MLFDELGACRTGYSMLLQFLFDWSVLLTKAVLVSGDWGLPLRVLVWFRVVAGCWSSATTVGILGFTFMSFSDFSRVEPISACSVRRSCDV